jgi:N-acetylglucosaminyldiphosphoundecaprenol N-acetyl-beta-D-mannosaminyltransferase
MDIGDMRETVAQIECAIEERRLVQHVVVNVAKLVSMRDNRDLHRAVTACDIINIDGMGIVFGARMLGHQVPERVAGIDLFFELVALSARKQYRVFLLGGSADVIDEAATRIRHRFPDLNIVGQHHGYFWDDEMRVVDLIRQCDAQLLFVAITSPKKEIFISRWSNRLSVNFVMGVGGTFDLLAGRTTRAPLWMQRSGLEWFYRLIQEPRRMWRRYLVTNVRFAYLIARELLCSRRFPRAVT